MSSLIKQELLEKIAATDDEVLLTIIKQEVDYITEFEKSLYLSELSIEQAEELQKQLDEPFGGETESIEDFKHATNRWRTT